MRPGMTASGGVRLSVHDYDYDAGNSKNDFAGPQVYIQIEKLTAIGQLVGG
jgi:hypothetical protein